MSFEAYLIAKKIDSNAFSSAEPDLFKNWKSEFEQMHPNSFTMQKLNLINPIRRKYPLKETTSPPTQPTQAAAAVGPKPGKPVIKPKIN